MPFVLVSSGMKQLKPASRAAAAVFSPMQTADFSINSSFEKERSVPSTVEGLVKTKISVCEKFYHSFL